MEAALIGGGAVSIFDPRHVSSSWDILSWLGS